MNKEFKVKLKQSNQIHIPLPVDQAEYAEQRIRGKAAIEELKLSNCASLEQWHVDAPGEIQVSDEKSKQQEPAIKMQAPTRLSSWQENYARIYATPYLTCQLADLDLQGYNRIAIKVWPEMPGFKHVSLHLQLVNEGEHPIPDRYMREGCHNINLINHQWNEASVEIPNVFRDKVTAIKIGYDMVGNEREATDTACFYIKDIRAEKITACEKYKGWEPDPDKIIFCGSGYQTTAVKLAFAAAAGDDRFRVIETRTGKLILEKEVKKVTTVQGCYAVMDFTEVEEPGSYLLLCGTLMTRVIQIADDVWEDSLWKSINLFFCERCGYEVPGIHKYCHGNTFSHYHDALHHDKLHHDKSVVSNGGWHDAADMSQNLTNTADAVYALFYAANMQRGNQKLFHRLVEEGKWGLDWMLRTRFENGYRATGSGGSVWTSNIQGECDQIDHEAQRLAIENFMAAAAEALAARVIAEIDPIQSQYLKKVAKEDWYYAYEDIDKEQYVATMDPARVSSPLLLYCMGVTSACELYLITAEEFYIKKAQEIAAKMLQCQQKDYPDWNIPLTGFFYRDKEKTQIQHYNHRCYEHAPINALSLLIKTVKDSPERIKWYHALLLYTEYLKASVKSTAPYHVAPASIYHVNEAKENQELFLAQQAFAHTGMLDEYKEQVENGVALGDGYYLKRYPVWFSYRGNNGLVLSSGAAAAIGAAVRNDISLQQLSHQQLEWLVGKNPFGQSLMIGEGYEYADQYVCLPGEISGGICVGIQSFRNSEEPYWPQCINAVYRELWIHPTIRYLILAGTIHGRARINGCLKGNDKQVIFERIGSGKCYKVPIEPLSGHFKTELPAGEYKLYWSEKEMKVTFVSNKAYEITDDFFTLEAGWNVKGEEVIVTVSGAGEGEGKLQIMTDNIAMKNTEVLKTGETKILTGKIADPKCPWLISITVNQNENKRVDLYPSKIVWDNRDLEMYNNMQGVKDE